MKKCKNLFIAFFVGLCFLTTISPVFATDVNITTYKSTVANLNYEIHINNKIITEDITVEIVDESGKKITEAKTKDGLLLVNNVSLGNYTIILHINENKYPYQITIDDEYIKHQHEIKVINVDIQESENDSGDNGGRPGTGDNFNIATWIILALLSGSFCILTAVAIKDKNEG